MVLEASGYTSTYTMSNAASSSVRAYNTFPNPQRSRCDTIGTTSTAYTDLASNSAAGASTRRPPSSGASTVATTMSDIFHDDHAIDSDAHNSDDDDGYNEGNEAIAVVDPEARENTPIPTRDHGNTASSLTPEIARMWNETLEEQIQRIKPRKYAKRLREDLTFEQFEQSLQEADRKNSESRIVRYTRKLLPALQIFSNLSPVIANLVQQASSAHLPSLSGFFFGIMQVLIVLASRYGSLLETIAGMITELTVTLNQFSVYQTLFPSSEELLSCIKILITDYVGFCISSYRFFIRFSPLGAFIRMLWRTIDSKFEEAKKNIGQHFELYIRTRQAIVDKTLIEGQNNIIKAIGKGPVIAVHTQPGPVYDVPFTRNENYFSGRNETLQHLHENLTKSQGQGSNLRTCVLHGLPGVGKTHVTVEYTYRYREEYQFIFWIRAETALELQAGVERIVENLHLAKEGIQGPMDTFRKWLENTKPEEKWLVIFDNAESSNWETLQTCWPRSVQGNGSIILTAQNPEFVHVFKTNIFLQPFDVTEGAEFLLKCLPGIPEEEKKVAESISYELGGLPLAIAHIAGFLSGSGITNLTEFLESFKERVNSAEVYDQTERPLTASQYNHKTMGVVWDVALQRLASDPYALQLIQLLSMMNSNGVPEDLLFNDHEAESLEFLTPKKDKGKVRFNKMIQLLRTGHLVDREIISGIACLSMHRELQRSILHRLDKNYEGFQEIFDMAFTLIRRKFPKQSPIHAPQSESWTEFELYRPHVMNLHKVYVHSKEPPRVTVGLAELLSDAGYFFYDRGILLEGITASDTAEKIIDSFPDGNLVLRANVYTVAGIVRWDRGMPARKKMLQSFLKCLSLRQQHMNSSSVSQQEIILYANAWNDVGMILAEFECYEDAIACAELSSRIRHKAGDKWSWLQSERLRAQALSGMGKHRDAVACIVQDENLPMEITSPTSDIAAGSYPQQLQYNNANILLNAGEWNQAYIIFQAVLERRQGLFGEISIDALSAQYMLAVIKQKKGKLTRAKELLEEILEKSENWSDVLLARTQSRLAHILENLGEKSEATRLRNLAEKTRKKVWEEHCYYIPINAQFTDEQVYDHIAPLVCGRTTSGAFQQTGKFPKLMEICGVLQERFRQEGDDSVGPCDVARICNWDGIYIPENEGFC